jgi:hypothetical protein
MMNVNLSSLNYLLVHKSTNLYLYIAYLESFTLELTKSRNTSASYDPVPYS